MIKARVRNKTIGIVERRVWYKMRSQLWTKISFEVHCRVRGLTTDQVRDQVEAQIYVQIYVQVRVHLWKPVQDLVVDIRNHIGSDIWEGSHAP